MLVRRRRGKRDTTKLRRRSQIASVRRDGEGPSDVKLSPRGVYSSFGECRLQRVAAAAAPESPRDRFCALDSVRGSVLELAVIIEDVNGQATAGGCRVLVDNNSTRLKRLNQRIGAYKGHTKPWIAATPRVLHTASRLVFCTPTRNSCRTCRLDSLEKHNSPPESADARALRNRRTAAAVAPKNKRTRSAAARRTSK